MPENSFLSAFLEDNPNMLYQAMRPQQQGAGMGRSFMDYWRGQQGNVWEDYLGSLGRTALGGEIPTQSYQSYLTGLPWMQRWQQMSPGQRKERPSLFSPRLRWNL